jgi:HAD superfamily hydrolase (TIGR01509 family)
VTHLDWSGCRNTRDLGGLPTRYGVRTRAGALIRTDSLQELDAAGHTTFAELEPGLVLDLDRNRDHIAQVLRAVADAPANRPVVVHCHAGKDRTGLLIALLLELAGVPREAIAADYALLELQDADPYRRTAPETILDSLAFVDSAYGGMRGYLGWLGLSAGEIHRLVARLVPVLVEAVVFDFDGLLMDTETTLVEAWKAEWRHHGLELDLDDGFWPAHGGDTFASHTAKLASAVGPGFDHDESFARRQAFREELHEGLDFRPGIRDWLAEARSGGLRVAIASSSTREWVVGNLERVGAVDLFDQITTGDEVSRHKPDPEIYLLALQRLGLKGEQTIAVEDTAHGTVAAASAGMSTVAIPNPFVSAEAVQHADLVLDSAADLSLSEVLLRLSSTS